MKVSVRIDQSFQNIPGSLFVQERIGNLDGVPRWNGLHVNLWSRLVMKDGKTLIMLLIVQSSHATRAELILEIIFVKLRR